MNLVDYVSQAEDHSSLLVLIQNINGKFHNKSFNRFFERISLLDSISINIPPQQQIITNQLNRLVHIRYVRQHLPGRNAWGNFQVNRRVLGLISLGFKSHENDEEDALLKSHDSTLEEFNETILDSRIFLFGGCPNSPSTSGSDKNLENVDNTPLESKTDSVNNHQQTLLNLRQTQVIKYVDVDSCSDVEDKIKEFLRSLFWVLEGKRLDRSHERSDNLLILTAPFEKPDNINFDMENKLHRKKCLGRFKKHLGDLCLLAGVPGEASLHYHTALDLLKQCSDLLWIAGSQEGIAVSSYLMLKPKFLPSIPFQRSYTLNKPNFSTLRNNTTNNLLSLPGNHQNVVSPNSDRISPKSLHEEILVNYNEAVVNYSKIKEAAFVEVEASLKACRVLTLYNRNLEAADFLQNIIRINLNISESEKIQHFSMLSLLYAGINMHRKASFYSRIATLVSAIVAKEDNNWPLCYRLLLQSFPGFKLSLDCRHIDYNVENRGWKSIQLRVLHELVYTSRHMEDHNVCIRHLLLLLHTMFDQLNTNEKTELFNVLRSYIAKCQPTLHSIALPDGTILPPVSFFKYPTLKGLRITKMLPCLRPIQLNSNLISESLFIYTPFTKLEDEPDSNIYCIVGEKCEIYFEFYNPLPFELCIDSLSAVVDGDAICNTTSSIIPAGSKSFDIFLTIIPNIVGTISITGYMIDVMGIKSHCKFREMPIDTFLKYQRIDFTIIVSPQLPLVQINSSFKNSNSFTTLEDGDFVTASASIVAYAGQLIEFSLNVANIGDIVIDNLEALLILPPKLKFFNDCLKWDRQTLISNLPFNIDSNFDIKFTIFWEPEQYARNNNSTFEYQSFDVQIMIRYSSNSSEYFRQVAFNLCVDLYPSLHITQVQLQPSFVHDKLYLSILFSNKLSNTVSLIYSHFKETIHLFPALSQAWISFFISHIEFEKLVDEIKLFNDLHKHFKNKLQISWTKDEKSNPEINCSGMISLFNITSLLNNPLLYNTNLLTWEVLLNKKRFDSHSRFKIKDSSVTVETILTNISDQSFENVSISFATSFCDDSDNDDVITVSSYHSASSIHQPFWIGSDNISNKTLNSKNKLILSSTLFSAIKTSVKLIIKCQLKMSDTIDKDEISTNMDQFEIRDDKDNCIEAGYSNKDENTCSLQNTQNDDKDCSPNNCNFSKKNVTSINNYKKTQNIISWNHVVLLDINK